MFARMLLIGWSLFFAGITQQDSFSQITNAEFANPEESLYPETWFHLIGGNVDQEALSVDLEAVANAGFQGIQLFHGRGRPWPGVKKQIQTLSEDWDSLIAHVANETERLKLFFTMQNCPGWAMSGGPWITPDRAMRHLVWSRTESTAGSAAKILLPVPKPSKEDWRDYRDVCVLAFPTPRGDQGSFLKPVAIKSNRKSENWHELVVGKEALLKTDVSKVGGEATWLEVQFDKPVELRSVELPNVETLMKRRSFDPEATIKLEAFQGNRWQLVGTRKIPRGNWQDRQTDVPIALAFSDSCSDRYRITFDSSNPMEIDHLRFSSTAKVNDWLGKSGYVLRSLEYADPPINSKRCYIDQAAIVDLSDRLLDSGELNWTAPQGRWTILRFGHVNTGVKNKPAPPEATGFECDKLATAGADQHFAGYIGRIASDGGPADEGRLRGMLIDSWECYTQTWTPAIEAEFLKRRKYELRRWLPAVAGYVVNDYESSIKFLRDWRKTISDMIVDNYFGRMAELAKQKGMRLSFETAVGDVSPGDILEYFKHADIPMCEFWQPNDPHLGGLETKPVRPTVSAARVYGKPVVAAEAFTNAGVRWDEHPFQLKPFADRHFAMGINQLVFHTYTHNPNLEVVPGTSFGNRIGSPFLRGQTWWRHMPLFTSYIARCQLMLQQGQPISDVLFYLGDEVDHKPRQDKEFLVGYQYDYLNQDALLNRIQVEGGKLKTPDGKVWRVLWMPHRPCKRLTIATLKRLKTLVAAGASVVCRPPQASPTLEDSSSESKADFTKLVLEIWGKDKSAGSHPLGKGRVFWDSTEDLGSLKVALEKNEVGPDVLGQQYSSWCHRRTATSDIYFVAADRRHAVDHSIKFRSEGMPSIWNPVTGGKKSVRLYDQADGYTTVPLSLPPGGSAFVVFDHHQAAQPLASQLSLDGKVIVNAGLEVDVEFPESEFPENKFSFGLQPGDRISPLPSNNEVIFDFNHANQLCVWVDGEYQLALNERQIVRCTIEGTETVELDSDWTLQFPDGWNAPKSLMLERLKPWSELADLPARAFSGTASYQTQFDLGQVELDQPVMLDLGQVHDVAEVIINGKSIRKLWAPPFRVDLTGLLVVGSNRLQVKVTNTWHNRLVLDAGLNPKKRKTWTIHGPKKKATLKPSGLQGPVRLRFGRKIDF